MAAHFPDHFSGHAELYRRYRPTYPAALYAWLAGLSRPAGPHGTAPPATVRPPWGWPPTSRPWWPPTPAPEQLGHARSHTACLRPRRRRARARSPTRRWTWSRSPRPCTGSTCDAFYREARRVARPGGHLAVWTYSLVRAGPRDRRRRGLVLRRTWSVAYWPPERQHVHERYERLPFPFDEMEAPATFDMAPRWTRQDLLGQLSTWSSVNRYRDARREDPLALLEPRLAEVWPEPDEVRTLSWPIILRVGRL